MGGNNTRDDGIKTTRVNSKAVKPKGKWNFKVNIIIFWLLTVGGLLPVTGYSQTLDEAVDRQLAIGLESLNPCEMLRAGDPLSVLEGPLKEICNRPTPSSKSLSSNSTGGGAGTATTLPAIVNERLHKAREKEAEETEADSNETMVELGKGLNLFLSGEYEVLDRDVSTFEDGYDSDIRRLTTGADIQLTKHLFAGLAANTSKQNGDFTGDGSFSSESYGIVGFSSYLPTDRSFVQVYGGYATNSHDRRRVATFTELDSDGNLNYEKTGVPDADYDADQFSAGILAGYDQPVGKVTISPRVGLDWVNTAYDTYSEAGDSGLELTFHDDEQTSLQSTVGLLTSVPFSTDFGVMTLQGAFNWKHEFDQKQRDVEVSFVGDTRSKRFTYETEKPDEDFFEFNGGFSMVLPNGIQPYGNFRALLGHKFFDNYAVAVGLRIAL